MSSTNFEFQLEPFDTHTQIRKKIARAFCEPNMLDRNFPIFLTLKVVFWHGDDEHGILLF